MSQSRDKGTRPRCNPPRFECFPEELIGIPSWVHWVYYWDPKRNKWTKPPVSIRSGNFIDPEISGNIFSFDEAKALYENKTDHRHVDGIGFYLRKDFALIGIDIDDCVKWEGESPVFDDWAKRILEVLPVTYTEFSPSRSGLRIFIQTEPEGVPELSDGAIVYRPAGIEIYDSGRHLSITGDLYRSQGDPPKPLPIESATDEIRSILQGLIKLRAEDKARKQLTSLSTEARLRAAFRAANGDRIKALYDGDASGFTDTSPDGFDHSAADFSLLRYLCYYSSGDPDILYELFRGSKLYRPGTDKYLASSIDKILETHDGQFWEIPMRPSSRPSYSGIASEGPPVVTGKGVAVYKASNLIDKAIAYRHRSDLHGLSTAGKLKNLDDIFRPRPGLLTVWTGEPGAGKSTFILAYLYIFCLINKLRAAVCSFELNPPERIVLELAQLHTQLNPYASEAELSHITDDDLVRAIEEFSPYFSILAPDFESRNVEAITGCMTDESILYLDPFTEFQPPAKLLGKYTDFVSRELSLLRSKTEEKGLITHLVCHPTKSYNRQEGLKLWNINGSGDFERKADFGIVITREGDTTILDLQKVRDRLTGKEGHKAAFRLDTEAYYFRETQVPIHLTNNDKAKGAPQF